MNLFDIAHLQLTLKELEKNTLDPNFWTSENKDSILKQISNLKNKTDSYEKIDNEYKNIVELAELVLLEEDTELAKEIISNTYKLEKEIEKLELQTLLSEKYDHNNAIITLHPGARRNRITRLGRNAV